MQADTKLPTAPPLPGADLVTKLNAIIETLGTNFAGPDDPAAIAWPFATWADTVTLTLKRRNAANTAWIAVADLFFQAVSRNASGQIIGAAQALADGQADYNSAGLASRTASETAGDSIIAMVVAGAGVAQFRLPRSSPTTLNLEDDTSALMALAIKAATSPQHAVTKAQLDASFEIYGSNANGEYYRDPKAGRQICISPNIDGYTSTPAGSIFSDTPRSWTFPAAFSSAPAASGSENSGVRWVNCQSITSGGLSVQRYSYASSTTVGQARIIAIGKYM